MEINTEFSPGDKAFVIAWPDRNPTPMETTVGKVQVEVVDSPGRPGEDLFHNYMPQKDYKESYMVVECGIGSGSVFTLGKNIFRTKYECQSAINVWRTEQKLKTTNSGQGDK